MNAKLNLGEDATAHLFAGRFVGHIGVPMSLKAIKAQIAKMDGHALGELQDLSGRKGGLGNV